jgi:hypothetical protein
MGKRALKLPQILIANRLDSDVSKITHFLAMV